MSGLTYGPIGGQPFYGAFDCIIIKVYLANCSVIYVSDYGGSGDDLSSILTFSMSLYGGLDGMLLEARTCRNWRRPKLVLLMQMHNTIGPS